MLSAAELERASEIAAPTDETGAWPLHQKLVFRFVFVYLSLYIVFTQMLSTLLNGLNLPNLALNSPFRRLVSVIATSILHVNGPLVVTGSGSGDKTFDWISVLCFFVAAISIATLWSVLDRHRRSYNTLHPWFVLTLRFVLGATLLAYGSIKVFPAQMPFPPLHRFVEPFGNFSPMGVLWTSIGVSPAYEMFTGWAEVLAGVLVMLPWTTTLGALIALAATVQVFALNMTYDVPVKLFSFHLCAMCITLLAPNLTRLADFFVRNKSVTLASPPLLRSAKANRLARIGQVVIVAYLIFIQGTAAHQVWKRYGNGTSRPVLYGIWEVNEMKIDGDTRPPLLTDTGRWRRVIFESSWMTIQLMDDTLRIYPVTIDPNRRTISMLRSDYQVPNALSFERTDEHLVLTGQSPTSNLRLDLQMANDMPLMKGRFHWVQEYPINR